MENTFYRRGRKGHRDKTETYSKKHFVLLCVLHALCGENVFSVPAFAMAVS